MVAAVFFRSLQQTSLHALALRVQTSVLPHHIKFRTTGVVWIKVRVFYYQRFRITFIQFTKQSFQRTLLSLRSSVARSLAVNGKPYPRIYATPKKCLLWFLQCVPTCTSGRPRSIEPSVGIT